MRNDPNDDLMEFGIDSAGMNAARDRQMYADLGLFNPADDEAYFSNQGGVFFDPAIGEEVFRPYTAEEFEYLTTGQTGFKTGADSFVDYVGDGRVETGDGNRRTFYSDEGGFTDYRDITDRNAPVLTTTPDGKSAVYKDGKFITQGMPGFGDALAAALKLATGLSNIKTGLTGGKRSLSDAKNAFAFSAKELPQSAIRTAAAGGLMTYAGGGAIDQAAYFAANPDVAASGMSAQEHYDMFGQYEGRDPGGATSGAQTHYWDSPDWLSQAGNGGGTRATGIQSSSTPVNLAGNLPGNASFYKAPGQFEGQNFSVGLSAQGWENVQRAVAGGMDFNEAVIRNSGDGIGTAVLMPADSGYLPYGVDVITGQAVMGMGTGAGSAAAPARPSGPSGGAIYNPVAQQPYPYRPSDIYNSPQYANVGDPGVNPIVSSQSPMPMGGNAVTKPYEAIRSSSRLLEEGVRPGSAWNRGGGQVVYNPINAASGGLMGLQNETNLGRYAGGGLGRLVQGPGDGVSDSVPAMIGGQQPALIAQGEYVLPARVVSELGNGSTEAGAKRIDQMVAKIEQMGRSAGRGKDSGAYKLLG